MKALPARLSCAPVLFAALLLGCDKLKLDQPAPQSTQRPTADELKKIHYMSQSTARDGSKVFDRLEQAKSCRDLELAMRWNRPPDIEGGAYGKKMVYLSSTLPSDLPKQSEVFLSGTIKRGEILSSGSSGWSLKMKDGSEVQVIEPAEYWQRQEQLQQENHAAGIVRPYTPGRKLCVHGIYQGLMGKSLEQHDVPLVSALFAIDRDR